MRSRGERAEVGFSDRFRDGKCGTERGSTADEKSKRLQYRDKVLKIGERYFHWLMTVPTLILIGELDTLTSPPQPCQELTQGYPGGSKDENIRTGRLPWPLSCIL